MKNEAPYQSGQSLIEAIIAIGIIVVGLFSIWALFMSNNFSEQESETRILASNLAREGIEAVKNIRDTDWLKRDENIQNASNAVWLWDQNTSSTELTYNYGIVQNLFVNDYVYIASTSGETDSANKLYLRSDGFYDHNLTGSSTPYSRVLIFTALCCPTLDNVNCTLPVSISTSTNSGGCVGGKLKIGMDVISKVKWTLNRQPRSVAVEDQIFNWR